MAGAADMSEYQLQRYVVDLLRYSARQDVLWFAIPNGEYRFKTTGAKLKASGVIAGAADLLIIIKGRAHLLELKWGKGRLSPEQIAFAAAAEAAGASYAVARSPEQARDILQRWDALRPDSVADVVKHMLSA